MQSHAPGTLTRRQARRHLTRTAVTSAALLAALVAPQIGMAAASATPAPPDGEDLPPGVIRLLDGETCPENILCLWRDHKRTGPGYGISEGYKVYLSDLPCGPYCVGGPTMANNVSSWWNRTKHIVKLIDLDHHVVRYIKPKQSLEESAERDNSVDLVLWVRVKDKR